MKNFVLTVFFSVSLFFYEGVSAEENSNVKMNNDTSPIEKNENNHIFNIPMAKLLEGGFEIKAMQYLDKSMVFTLQKWKTAFVCETKFSGETIVCVELR